MHMGFLEFLKKQPPAPALPAPSANVSPPREQPLAPPQISNAPITWDQSPDAQPAAPLAVPASPPDELPPLPPAQQPGDTAYNIDDIKKKLGMDDALEKPMDDLADVPLPPEPMKDSQMLDDASMEYRAEQSTPGTKSTDIMDQLNASLDREIAKSKMAPNADLPDFTDEELASLDVKPPVPPPAAPLPPAPVVSPFAPQTPTQSSASPVPTMKMVSQEPAVAPPANAVAMPKDPVSLPVGITVEAEDLVPAKFVSSNDYFIIKNDIKAARKTLRQGDEQLKDSVLRHEQLDLQYRRVASDMNGIQEQLMHIDHALFEE
jgi:hypothetical protein